MRKLLTIFVVAMLLAGCGATSPSDEADGQLPASQAPTSVPAAPEETATMPTDNPEAAAMALIARKALAERVGVAEDTIQVTRVEPVEWADGSLGCPQPGMLYPQVITPGFRVVLEQGGKTYIYHTDLSRIALPCDAAQTQ